VFEIKTRLNTIVFSYIRRPVLALHTESDDVLICLTRPKNVSRLKTGLRFGDDFLVAREPAADFRLASCFRI